MNGSFGIDRGWLCRPFGADDVNDSLPRALPWAVIGRPFGASAAGTESDPSPGRYEERGPSNRAAVCCTNGARQLCKGPLHNFWVRIMLKEIMAVGSASSAILSQVARELGRKELSSGK